MMKSVVCKSCNTIFLIETFKKGNIIYKDCFCGCCEVE